MWNENVLFIISCYKVSFISLSLCFLLEFLSWNEYWNEKIQSNKRLQDLYLEALKMNYIHELITGPILYGLSLLYISSYEEEKQLNYLYSTPLLLLTQNLGYAYIHNWMHKPVNHWIHTYHHLYNKNTFVRPIAAHAVSHSEFMIAYAGPIMFGVFIFKPEKQALFITASSISVLNLLIHTPQEVFKITEPFFHHIPEPVKNIFVTNKKHFFHHEENPRSNYSAPLLDLDNVLMLNNKSK
tara:strand:- start:907 stop:1626 length:720 start_codon:yes stop_codon:yes gene_type:complete